MTMPVMKISKAATLGALLKYEAHADYSRETFTIKGGSGAVREIKIGTPLALENAAGEITTDITAGADNTGDGTLAMGSPEVTNAVKPGVYTVVCTTGGADGVSKFSVEAPDGKKVGTATGGAEFAGHVRFTISGGAADFVENDRFEVEVSVDAGPETGLVVAWDPDAADQTGAIWGLAANDITAQDAVDTFGGLAVRRHALVDKTKIVWPDTAGPEQQAAALQELEDLGIIAR